MMNASYDLYCLYCENDYIIISNFYQSIKNSYLFNHGIYRLNTGARWMAIR